VYFTLIIKYLYFQIDARLLNDTIMAMTHKSLFHVPIFWYCLVIGQLRMRLVCMPKWFAITTHLYGRLLDSVFTAWCCWREICRCYLISRKARSNLENELIDTLRCCKMFNNDTWMFGKLGRPKTVKLFWTIKYRYLD